MKRKQIAALALALVCLAGTTACSGNTATATQATTTAVTTTTPPATFKEEDAAAIAEIVSDVEKLENGTVKFLSSWDINPADGKPKTVALEMFETQYGGKIEYIQTTWDDRYSSLAKLVAAGDSPDMFSAEDLDIFPKGAVKNMFRAMDDYIDYSAEMWDPMRNVNELFAYNGKHYVAAISTDAGVVMIYNKRVIEENGLDDPAELVEKGEWNWDTFYDMMIKFCDRDQGKFAIDGWWFEGAFSLTSGRSYIGMENGKLVSNLDDRLISKVQEFMLNMKNQDLPYPKSEHAWQICPSNIGDGKTLFYPCGIWALYEKDLSNYGEMDEIMFVPMPRCPDADAYYLPTAIKGFSMCAGATNPEGVAAYINCAMACRDNETAIEIGKKQVFEDYNWTQEMYDMLLKTQEMTAAHPMIEYYQAVSDDLYDTINNPMKESYNAGISWTQTKESIKLSVQAELDLVNKALLGE